MDWAAGLGFDLEELFRRRDFLIGRALWHAEFQAGTKDTATPGRLFAATLWRDAAAISIIIGDFPNARQLLKSAAVAYLSQDVLYGLLLATLAGDRRAWRTYAPSLAPLRVYLADPHVQAEGIPQDVPLPYVPQSDLVSTLQSFAVAPPQMRRRKQGDDDGERRLFEQLNTAVEDRLGIQDEVGPSSLYVRALLTLTSDEANAADVKLPVERYLTALVTAREADIAAARKDKFNWSLMQNPADVVDFDVMVLAMALAGRGIDPDLIDTIFGGIDDPVALPIHASRALSPYDQS